MSQPVASSNSCWASRRRAGRPSVLPGGQLRNGYRRSASSSAGSPARSTPPRSGGLPASSRCDRCRRPALADRDPALEGPVRLCMQGGHARRFGLRRFGRNPRPPPVAGSSACPRWYRRSPPRSQPPTAAAGSGNTHGLNFSRAQQRAVFRIELGRFVEEVAGLVMLAQHPQHFADMGGDLRVLARVQARRSCTSASSLRLRRYSTQP